MVQLLSVGGAIYVLLGEGDHVTVMDETTGAGLSIDPTSGEQWDISKMVPTERTINIDGVETRLMYEDLLSIPIHEEDRCEVPDGELLYGNE